MKLFTLACLLSVCSLVIVSCQKEISWDDLSNQPGTGTGGGGTGTTPGGCGNVVMKVKRFHPVIDTNLQITVEYDGSGKMIALRNNMLGSRKRTANYYYENNRIVKAALYDIASGNFEDTVKYVYGTSGRLDSIYLKNDDNFNLKLTYDAAGRLQRIMRYDGTVTMFYQLVTERYPNGNIKKVEDREPSGSVNTYYEYKWDDRKNPFEDIALYMFHLDDEEMIFRFYGKFNYTDEAFLHTHNNVGGETGLKYSYNSNCYPKGAQVTFAGMPLFPDDDFKWEYN